MALQVGIIGSFQNGKSTLINCLLEDRVAISGDGISTTKQIVKYFHSPQPTFWMQKNGIKKNISKQQYTKGFSDTSVSHYEVGLPIPLLKEVELIDTPGFDATERDDKVTVECLTTLDCAIVLLGGHTGGLNDATRMVLHHISQQNKPYVTVYNSQAVSDDQWNPSSKINRQLRDTTAAKMKQEGFNGGITIAGESVLPVNTAWFWRAFIEREEKQLTLPDNEGEKKMLRNVGAFACYGQLSMQTIEMDSNIALIKDFLMKDSFCFNNIHTITTLHKQLDGIRKAIDSVWNSKEKTT